jgi:hypothetical protein
MTDAINPDHYTFGGIETIDYLEAKLSPEEFAGFCRGNVLKYVSRIGHKDADVIEIGKAIWYLEKWRDSLSRTDTPTESYGPQSGLQSVQYPYHGHK